MTIAVCEECGSRFERKQYQKRCDNCRKFTCLNCGNYFLLTSVQWWHRKKGITKQFFCNNACKNEYYSSNSPRKGKRNKERYPLGTKKIRSDGYALIKIKDTGHQWIDWVLEHRHVMEQHIGRTLLSNEIVHHIDQDRKNNSINNLQILVASEHAGNAHRLGKNRKRDSLGRFIAN